MTKYQFTAKPDSVNRVAGKLPDRVEEVRQIIGTGIVFDVVTMAELIWDNLPVETQVEIRGVPRVVEHLMSLVDLGLIERV
jgi:hypothetical protein